MNLNAVNRAEDRYKRAERALLEFRAASNYQEAESAWTDFLTSASGIYSQLEQGVKGHGRSEGWFGRQKQMRRENPVLRYLHHARNAEEHGIERVTEQHPDGGRKLLYGQSEQYFVDIYDPATKKHKITTKGWIYGPHLKLTRVYDRRYGDYFDPPYSTVEPSGDPAAFADAAMILLRCILDQARTFT